MSHFYVLVLMKPTPFIDRRLSELMGPYDENLETELHEEDCACIGNAARRSVAELTSKEFGTVDDMRKQYWGTPENLRPDWDTLIAPRIKFYEERLAAHPLRNSPDGDCDECEGTGKCRTARNQNSKWDWYQIGGRWTGVLSGYDPEKDPDNEEVCPLCNGTGVRVDMKVDGGCNACHGSGRRKKWATQWKSHDGDVQLIGHALATIKQDRDRVPYALVTPEGEWLEKGEMGWFGMSANEKPENVWVGTVIETLEKYKEGHMAVVVDCHI